MIMNDVRPGGPRQFVTGLTEQVDDVLGRDEAFRSSTRDIVDHAEHSDHRRWQIGVLPVWL